MQLRLKTIISVAIQVSLPMLNKVRAWSFFRESCFVCISLMPACVPYLQIEAVSNTSLACLQGYQQSTRRLLFIWERPIKVQACNITLRNLQRMPKSKRASSLVSKTQGGQCVLGKVENLYWGLASFLVVRSLGTNWRSWLWFIFSDIGTI